MNLRGTETRWHSDRDRTEREIVDTRVVPSVVSSRQFLCLMTQCDGFKFKTDVVNDRNIGTRSKTWRDTESL